MGRLPIPKRWASLLLGLATTAQVHGAELVFSEAVKVGERYRVRVEMRVDVSAEQAHALLTDFGRLGRLNPGIVESEVLESEGTRHRIRLESRGCVMFFCRNLHQVQDVSEFDGYIAATVDPEFSDFRYGRLLWRIVPEGPDRSLISFRAELEPAVWVPPLIGSWAIRNLLKDQTETTLRRLENVATQ